MLLLGDRETVLWSRREEGFSYQGQEDALYGHPGALGHLVGGGGQLRIELLCVGGKCCIYILKLYEFITQTMARTVCLY